MDIYHLSWILYIVVLAVKCVITESSNCPTFFNQSDRTDKQINVMEHDLQRCHLFYDIVVILEQLNILIPRNTSCYTLQSVFQSFDKKDPQSDFQTMKITFKFQERFKISPDKTDIEKSSNSMCKKEPVMYNTPFVGKQSIYGIQGINESEQANDTVALPKSGVDNEDSSVLSHTQVVVIATCSAVIGTFFILAAALRIRNYIKRLREDQQSSRRTNNYSLPLSKGSNSLEGHSRKSSTTSRNSQQNSLLDRDGNDNHGNIKLQSACRQPLLDAMPLLIVTAPSTATSTPGDSHSSIQFIDEDVNILKRTYEDNTVEMSQNDKPDTETEYNHIKNQNKMDAMNNMDITNEAEQVATDENGVELDNNIVRTHESCEYHQDNKEYIIASDISPQSMHSVNIGLTQSDDSLSSHNASYCYGNQVEYAASGWYGNIGYYPPIQMEDNNVEHYHGNSKQCSPRTTENNFKRFCDNGDATSFERDELRCAMKDKMHSDEVAESRPALKDTHNVISLDQYEQRRKLQRQDRTLTQTMSFESDAF